MVNMGNSNTARRAFLALTALLLVVSTTAPAIAGTGSVQEQDGVVADDVVESMSDETAYRTNFSLEITAGNKNQMMSGWMEQNETTGRAHGEIVASGAQSIDAEFYLTEDRFYFNRSDDYRWYWKENDGDAMPRGFAPQIEDILKNGTVLEKETNQASGTTTFRVRPTDEQLNRWLGETAEDATVTHVRYVITINNETERVQNVDIDVSGSIDGKAFSATATFEFSGYDTVVSISVPERVQKSPEYTIVHRLTGGFWIFPSHYEMRQTVLNLPPILKYGVFALGGVQILLFAGFLFTDGAGEDGTDGERESEDTEYKYP